MKIRRLGISDLSIRNKLLSDVRVSNGITIDLPISEHKSLSWFENVQKDDHRIDFSFLHSDIVIGFGGVVNIQHRHKLAEIYIFIDPSFQGQGHGKSSLVTMLNFIKMELSIRKVTLYTVANNNIANKLYTSVGFTKEGVLKNHIWHRGQYVDRLIYSIFLDDLKLEISNIYEDLA